jgi:tRNA(Ile)-lysidine synthase
LKRAETGFSVRALACVLGTHLDAGAVVKVAYSGGVDSHVLLHALCRLREKTSWTVGAIHIDHGLHSQSASWAAHCQRVCDALEVTCIVERIQILPRQGEGVEGVARRRRYASLARHIGRGEVMFTAHHLDDQAETVLLQLLRGAGVRGLAGIAEVKTFAGGRLLRPLLGFTRDELLDYAQRHELKWVEDSSNRDTRHSRNFVRHEVLPLLERRWPAARRLIARAGEHASQASEVLDAVAASDLAKATYIDPDALSVPALMCLAAPRRDNLIRYWIRRRGFAAPSALLLRGIAQAVESTPRSQQATVTWPGVEVRRYRDALWVMRPLAEPDTKLDLTWAPTTPLAVPGTGYILRAEDVIGSGLAREQIATAKVSVRLRRGGEICHLPGRRHHHKLKKLLQDAHVPPWERQRLPLIFADDVLAAVADRWVCAPFAARAGERGWRIVLERAEKQ